MDQQHAQITLQFLQRVTLQPAEIQAFQAVVSVLQGIAQPTPAFAPLTAVGDE